MANARYEALKHALSSDLSLQKAAAKIDFATEVWHRMEAMGINKTRLADSLGKSAPWVTKILSGDSNFTIETMVALADAVNGELLLRIEQKKDESALPDTNWVKMIAKKQFPQRGAFARTFSKGDSLLMVWNSDQQSPCNDEMFLPEEIPA